VEVVDVITKTQQSLFRYLEMEIKFQPTNARKIIKMHVISIF